MEAQWKSGISAAEVRKTSRAAAAGHLSYRQQNRDTALLGVTYNSATGLWRCNGNVAFLQQKIEELIDLPC